MVQVCRIRQAHDKCIARIISCKSNLQLLLNNQISFSHAEIFLNIFFLFHLCSLWRQGKKNTSNSWPHICSLELCVSTNFFANSKVWSTWSHTCRTLVVNLLHAANLYPHSHPLCRQSLLAARSWFEEKVVLEIHDLIGWMFFSVQCSDWYRTIDSRQSVTSDWWNWRASVKNAHRIFSRFPVPRSSLQTIQYFFTCRYVALPSN